MATTSLNLETENPPGGCRAGSQGETGLKAGRMDNGHAVPDELGQQPESNQEEFTMNGISFSKDMFPSRFFKAVDLEGDTILKIQNVALEPVGQEQDDKPVVSFVGQDKKFILNVTNGAIIADAFGDNADDWVGRMVCLYPTKAQFGSKMVDAIRVKVPEENAGKLKAKSESGDGEQELDDELPDFSA